MTNRYHWIMSSRLIPEIDLFEDADETHRVLESSLTVTRLPLLVFMFAAWVAACAYLCRNMAPMIGVEVWITQFLIQPVWMLIGFYVFYNYGLRRPFQRALRQALQEKGVPICLGCGYDLRGQLEARCPECALRFSKDLLDQGVDGDSADRS